MRPKKIVLVVDLNTERLAEMVYILRVRGYAQRQANSLESALDALESHVDCVICRHFPPAMQMRLHNAIRVMQPSTPLLAVGVDSQPSSADVVMPDGSTMEMLQRLQILVARKRGPKPAPALTEEQLIERIRLDERRPVQIATIKETPTRERKGLSA